MVNYIRNQLFVSFDDDATDPTYQGAEACVLIQCESTNDDNPCVGENVVSSTPLVPKTAEELKVFAAMFGWDLQYDNDGQCILYTGIQAE